MLLGTHPIPARSPAEREGGQNGKETRKEGDRGGLEETWTRRRDGEFMGGERGAAERMIWGGDKEKVGNVERRGVEKDGLSWGERREKMEGLLDLGMS